MSKKKDGGIYRSLASYGDPEFSRFMRRAFLAAAGYDQVDVGRPIVGIADTSSDYNPCHRDLPAVIEAIKRGVLEAGGLPLVFPAMSLNEIFINPTTMLYRNLMALELEEMITAQPMDAVVLTGGCDKTVPAEMMAAASADLPALIVVSGPMRTGSFRGERLGACTDCRRLWAKHRAGELSEKEIAAAEAALCPTGGTCMVMGTASTMAALAETLGLMLPGGATPPSGSGDRLRHAVASGRAAVELAKHGPSPRELLTRAAFENAMLVLGALSGSTNAVIHLLAIARRAGVKLTLDDFHAASQRVPVLVDVKPAGAGYMEDFHNAGGVPVLWKALEKQLELSARSVAGKTLKEILSKVSGPASWQKTIRPLSDPLGPPGALSVVRGSLAPEGAVIKASAATRELLVHKGPAVVFESVEDMAARIDDPSLEVTADSVLVLRNAGPIAAGMPEAGYLPIPKKLARAGVRDMVRVSDARMSGTAFGTVVLHCAPEAAAKGPLALVKDGDLIELNVPEQRIELLVDEKELAKRRAKLTLPTRPARGWKKLHAERVMQAHLGADLDFMGPEGK